MGDNVVDFSIGNTAERGVSFFVHKSTVRYV